MAVNECLEQFIREQRNSKLTAENRLSHSDSYKEVFLFNSICNCDAVGSYIFTTLECQCSNHLIKLRACYCIAYPKIWTSSIIL